MKKLFLLSGAGILALTVVFGITAMHNNRLGLARAVNDDEYEMTLTHANTVTTLGTYDSDLYAFPFELKTKTPTGFDFASDAFDSENYTGTFVYAAGDSLLSVPEDGLLTVTLGADGAYCLAFNLQFTFFGRALLDTDQSYIHYRWTEGGVEKRKTEHAFDSLADSDNTYSAWIDNHEAGVGDALTIEKIYLSYICV